MQRPWGRPVPQQVLEGQEERLCGWKSLGRDCSGTEKK